MQSILLLLALLSLISAFQLQQSKTYIAIHKRYPSTYLQAKKNEGGGDNKAMAFLRKKGRVGGAANMDFANVCGPDESPGGGKQAHKEDGFQVSTRCQQTDILSFGSLSYSCNVLITTQYPTQTISIHAITTYNRM